MREKGNPMSRAAQRSSAAPAGHDEISEIGAAIEELRDATAEIRTHLMRLRGKPANADITYALVGLDLRLGESNDRLVAAAAAACIARESFLRGVMVGARSIPRRAGNLTPLHSV
jgi:hypothetical protein